MPSSRARKRIAAVAAAIPVLVAGGPFSAPALASDPYVVTNLLLEGQTLGPNAGYLGLGVGQGGSTAMFKIAVPSASATISSLQLTLTQVDNLGTFIYQNEFDATDGLALYADVNGNGAFDAADKATGMRSSGYRAGRPQANGDIPFILSFNSAASGVDTYFVALHPAATATTGRRFAFTVDAGHVVGSGGTGPVNAVSTPLKVGELDKRVTIDASAPAQPNREQFAVNLSAPGEEDSYTYPASVVSEPTAKIGFFKSGASTAPGSLLTRPGFNPLVPVTEQFDKVAFTSALDPGDPTAARTVKIGDGSGIFKNATPPVLVAKNNQDTNAVYARLVDSVGNLSLPAELTDCFISTAPGAPQTCSAVKNANPVIAPDAPTNAELHDGSSALAGINIANEAAVPARATTASISAFANRTDADTKSLPQKVAVRIAQKLADGTISNEYTTATKELTYSSTIASFTGTNAFDTRLQESTPKGIQQGNGVHVVAVNLDKARNPSSPKESAAYPKDTVAPAVTISSVTTPLAKGAKVAVQFSEPMITGDIGGTDPNATTGVCDDNEANASSVDRKLDVRDAAGVEDRTWGMNNCFKWLNDSSAEITIGEARTKLNPPGSPQATDIIELPARGDRVVFGSVRDKVGNALTAAGTTFTTITTPLPAPLSGATRDISPRDGVLEGVLVTFAAEMNLSSIQNALAQFSAVGPTTVPITGASLPDPNEADEVLFSFTSTFGTGDLPQIRYTPDAAKPVVDKANRPLAAFSVTPADGAIPLPKRAWTADESPRDGRIDTIRVEYTEPIQHNQDNNPAPNNRFDAAYTVPGYERIPPTSSPNESRERNTTTPTTGVGSVKSITAVRPSSAPLFDTAAVTFKAKFTRFVDALDGNKLYAPTDQAGLKWNVATTFEQLAADGAAPFYVSRHTRDLDADGRVDAIDVKFTENIPTEAAGASFVVTGRTIVDQYPLPNTTDTIRIEINETAPPTGDTAPSMTPTIQYLGGVKDLLGNAMPADAAPLATTDGAGPAIMAACPSSPKGFNGTCPEDDPTVETDDGTRMNVFFSEALNTGTVLPADFTVEQPAGATPAKTVASVLVTNATDGKSATATLTFAQGTLSNTLDSVIRFSGAGVVADNATPNVVSTQTANISALAPPTVDLALSCPTPTTNPQYCGSTTIGTGATGSTAVTKWRLKNTARGTVVDPAEYSSTRPDSITLVEGSHTLYLSGLDDFGRLSPEVSKTINILTAPKILNLQFQNAATPRANGSFPANTTVVDGDTVHIGADAYGTDAAEWAEDSAPTDGGCLREHMSINLNPLTNDSADDSVPPTTCDLHTTGEQPRRAMVFPTAKVSDTTRYPVGTVLKVSDSDPGSLIVDGSGGTIARRKFISVNARRSWMITDASVIRVPTHLVAEIPAQTKRIGYRDGAILRDSTGRYYYSLNGTKYPVSTSRLSAWRIPTSTAYRPSATELKAMPTGSAIGGSNHPTGTWVKFSSGATYQIVRNSKGALVRRQLGSTAALRTLVPTSHVYAGNSYDAKIPVDTTWLRGYRDGTVLVWRDSAGKITKTGVIARGSLRMFASNTVFNTLGFNVSNGLPASFAAMPRVPGKSYRTGTPIDRYALGEIVMRVTNKAGAAVTAAVPSSAGLFGVGTLDPRPADWDPTR